jgi:hypothetical protein
MTYTTSGRLGTERKQMEQCDVERIARGVLVDLGAPFSLVSVERTATGWRVVLSSVSNRRLIALLPGGPASAVRAALRQQVEFEE